MKRGWCPTVHTPMPSGDGLLLRVKPFGGHLTAAMLRVLAQSATDYGNGTIELTARGNIQLRGIHHPAACAARLVAAGLADPDPAREARRNVIAVPPANPALLAEVEALLSATPGLAPKFCVAVGPANADIVVVDGRLRCALGEGPYSPNTLRSLLKTTNGQRLREPSPSGRGPGEGVSNDKHPATSLSLRERAGVRVVQTTTIKRTAPPSPCSLPKGEGSLLYLPFGQTTAETLATLAAQVPSARTTPWRALLVPGTPTPPGFITDPADPRLHIAACPGGPACASGTVPARADAAWLAPHAPPGLHVSGCAKGCAHPRPAPLTLVGRAGRYDLVRNGRASDPPALTGLTLAQAAAVVAA